MSKHLKTTIFLTLTSTLFQEVPSPAVSKVHARGVRYLYPIDGINYYCGMMNSHKQGQKYRKHIIVRRVPRFGGLHQLYTYHFPKTWSAACVANRELIKTAQKLAHALEHDYSPEGIEWRLRFFHHYFHVVKGGAKPEPGLKPYTRFYQYVYVSIYRDLKSAAEQSSITESLAEQPTAEQPLPEEVSFEPIDPRPLRSRRTYPLNALTHRQIVTPPSIVNQSYLIHRQIVNID